MSAVFVGRQKIDIPHLHWEQLAACLHGLADVLHVQSVRLVADVDAPYRRMRTEALRHVLVHLAAHVHALLRASIRPDRTPRSDVRPAFRDAADAVLLKEIHRRVERGGVSTGAHRGDEVHSRLLQFPHVLLGAEARYLVAEPIRPDVEPCSIHVSKSRDGSRQPNGKSNDILHAVSPFTRRSR